MAFVVKVALNASCASWRRHNNLLSTSSGLKIGEPVGNRLKYSIPSKRKVLVAMANTPVQSSEVASTVASENVGIPIMMNGCTGKMGRAVLEAAISAGLNPLPVGFGGPEDSGKILDFNGRQIEVHGPSDRESILSSAFKDHPDLIVVDYTVPAAVNDNAALYCKVGVPFVMGTTGGDRELLYKTVADSKVYAVISPQMGKQVVAFLAAMEIMAEQFPGAFSGYNLQVMESHQARKLDISGTAKAVISCFQKLGVSFELEQVQLIRDPKLQVEMVGVPEEHLSGHAFHMYHLTSPDGTVSFEFQHNVCGRSIYAEGTVDAILFLAMKVKSKADKRIYNMIDVLREGNMR
ncbi:4-hydroxy-tetrahydrodipicolinate reductase [Handroanthus impetiginosus]|uniref:4-hydroxy-tetrahydrodipicolinate reductase n=1 Tax=Handroanthus impetiginosus TaxID=429701 RepID=A0A2G9HFP9_9LAMI|nr:4-hydroxy-tetrahydrodipicolinate reductase [Handroanthus impetiginosus]